jgi:hypothetical protein
MQQAKKTGIFISLDNKHGQNRYNCYLTMVQHEAYWGSNCNMSGYTFLIYSSSESKFGNGIVVGCGLFKNADVAKCVFDDMD